MTIIDHSIRIKSNLTLREYVVLDFLRNWYLIEKKSITFGDFKEVWITPPSIHTTYSKLLDKGFLFKDVDGKIKTSDKWNTHFADNNIQFDELWKLHNIGNKQKAKSALIQALKVDSFDNIKNGLLEYIEFRKQTDQFPVHLSSFLNHKNKEWQTKRDVSIYKKKEAIAPQIINTGPKSVWDK